MRLTGSKLGCGEGGCGACTVTVAAYDARAGKVVSRSVNACLAPLCSVDGQSVVTVEGIGSTKKKNLHPVQVGSSADRAMTPGGFLCASTSPSAWLVSC